MNAKIRKTHQSLTLFVLFGFLLFAFTSCRGLTIRTMAEYTATMTVPVATATRSVTLTPSIVWFPPTATPLPMTTPTTVPTEDRLGELGKPYVTKGFSPKYDWQTVRSEDGNAILSDTGELTLSLPGTDVTIVTFSQIPYYRSYYLSVDVTLSYCSFNQDAYGILFRVADSDNYDRLWFNCLGQTRVERRHNGKMLPLSDWAANGKVRPGAPQKFTVGLKVDGDTIEVYLNGAFQYELTDDVLETGGIGLTARTSGVSPLTVSFTNLQLFRLR